jgi:hypothetical protein
MGDWGMPGAKKKNVFQRAWKWVIKSIHSPFACCTSDMEQPDDMPTSSMQQFPEVSAPLGVPPFQAPAQQGGGNNQGGGQTQQVRALQQPTDLQLAVRAAEPNLNLRIAQQDLINRLLGQNLILRLGKEKALFDRLGAEALRNARLRFDPLTIATASTATTTASQDKAPVLLLKDIEIKPLSTPVQLTTPSVEMLFEQNRVAEEARQAELVRQRQKQVHQASEAYRLQQEAQTRKRLEAVQARLAKEARIREQQEQASVREQQEQARIAEEARIREQQEQQARIAEEARIREQQEQQARIAEEARIREQQEQQALIAEEARIREQQEQQALIAEEARIREQQEQASVREQQEQARIAEEARIREQQEQQALIAEEARIREQQEQQARIAEEARIREQQEQQARIAEEARIREQQEQQARVREQQEQERVLPEEQARTAAAPAARNPGWFRTMAFAVINVILGIYVLRMGHNNDGGSYIPSIPALNNLPSLPKVPAFLTESIFGPSAAELERIRLQEEAKAAAQRGYNALKVGGALGAGAILYAAHNRRRQQPVLLNNAAGKAKADEQEQNIRKTADIFKRTAGLNEAEALKAAKDVRKKLFA